MKFHTNLTVAIASQLRDEAHVILADLNHLLTDVVLGAAGYRCASPPTGKRQRREAEGHISTDRKKTHTRIDGTGYKLNAT